MSVNRIKTTSLAVGCILLVLAVAMICLAVLVVPAHAEAAPVAAYAEDAAAASYSEEEGGDLLMVILISAGIAVMGGVGAAIGVAAYYKRKRHGEIYPLERYARLDLSVSRDVFLGKTVTHRYIPRNNGKK